MAQQQQTQTQTKAPQKPKLFTLNEVTNHLVVARPVFETVVRQEGLPLVWDSEFAFARDLVMADEYLRRVVPETLAAALRNIAHVGLTLNPIKQHCKIKFFLNIRRGGNQQLADQPAVGSGLFCDQDIAEHGFGLLVNVFGGSA